jgi:RHS repeat-associated protein
LSYDHLGSVRMVTDQSGNVVSRHDYLPFGEEITGSAGRGAQWGAADDVNQKFTGKERDAETGLDYFGARYYGSALGRFTSPDWSEKPEPVPYADLSNPQSLNQYAYVLNNPLAHPDEDGHCCDAVWDDLEDFGESLEGSGVPLLQAAGKGLVIGAAAGAALSNDRVQQALSDVMANAGGGGGQYGDFSRQLKIPTSQMASSSKGSTDQKAGPVKAADAAGVSAGGQATDEHGTKLGPSGKPQVNTTKSNTREAANNKALDEGSRSVEHSNPKVGRPHFHPADAQGKKKPSSTHHEYPEN